MIFLLLLFYPHCGSRGLTTVNCLQKVQAYHKLDSILHKEVCFPEACQSNDYPPISVGQTRIHLIQL